MKRYERYKPSKVEWIGEIPEHWEAKKLKYCFDFVTGFTPSSGVSQYYDGKYIWITIADMTNKYLNDSKQYITDEAIKDCNAIVVPKGSLLYSFKLSIGKVAFADVDLYTNEAIIAILENKEINLNYLYYSLPKQVIYNANENIYGAKLLNQDLIKNAFIVIPPNDEQKIIANYLDKKTVEIEELISDKKNLISLLEQEKELTISNTVTKGLNPDVPMKNSKVKWIGEIPKHWEVKKIKYIFTSFDNKRVPLSADERGKMSQRIYDYYGASGIIDKVESYIFDGDYLLIGEDGANLLDRNSDLVFKASGKFWVNNHAHILQPIKNDIDFYVYYLENLDFTMWISGSAQPKLTADALNNIHVAVPPTIEQQQIVEYLDKKIAETNEAVQIIKDEIELLKEYKETLIYEVITGKIDVRAEL